MISDHAWRALVPGDGFDKRVLRGDRPCQYMNCRRPKVEHEKAANRGSRWDS